MRQLGRPSLLAAIYSGDGPGAATAALEEVEAALATSLHELERGGTAATGAPPESLNPGSLNPESLNPEPWIPEPAATGAPPESLNPEL